MKFLLSAFLLGVASLLTVSAATASSEVSPDDNRVLIDDAMIAAYDSLGLKFYYNYYYCLIVPNDWETDEKIYDVVPGMLQSHRVSFISPYGMYFTVEKKMDSEISLSLEECADIEVTERGLGPNAKTPGVRAGVEGLTYKDYSEPTAITLSSLPAVCQKVKFVSVYTGSNVYWERIYLVRDKMGNLYSISTVYQDDADAEEFEKYTDLILESFRFVETEVTE